MYFLRYKMYFLTISQIAIFPSVDINPDLFNVDINAEIFLYKPWRPNVAFST